MGRRSPETKLEFAEVTFLRAKAEYERADHLLRKARTFLKQAKSEAYLHKVSERVAADITRGKEWLALQRSGMTMVDIGRKFGVGTGTVRKHILRAEREERQDVYKTRP